MRIKGTKQVEYPQVQVQPYLAVPVKQVTCGFTAAINFWRIGRISVLLRFTERAIVPEAFRDNDNGPRCAAPPSALLRVISKDKR
jgi:hypothetical protein